LDGIQIYHTFSRTIGVASARIARLEGMEGHARAADVRLEKFFPGEKFNLQPGGKM
jgi:sulfopropanediol 3-dehydrogenase